MRRYHSVYARRADGTWFHEASRDVKEDATDDRESLERAGHRVRVRRDDGTLPTILATIKEFDAKEKQ